MFSKTAILFAAVASMATAAPACSAPAPAPIPAEPKKFGLVAIRSASAVQYAGVTANDGNLSLSGPQRGTCDKPQTAATFYVQDGKAYLYSSKPKPLYVDRSGMGQGKLGFTDISTDPQPPRNAEQTGFAVNETTSHFTFDGTDGWIACPGANGTYSLWASAGISNPAGNTDCLGVALRYVEATDPVKCAYTTSPNQ